MYSLDEDESQGGIAINLLPLMAQDLQQKADCNREGRLEYTHTLYYCNMHMYYILIHKPHFNIIAIL